MSEFDIFMKAVEWTFELYYTKLDFMGMEVRPIDFILATGVTSLFVDLFRMIVMRGRDD